MSDMGKMPEGGCHGTQEWVEGLVTDSCPVMYTVDYSFLFTSFVWVERGLLPFTGGWAEQPTNLIDGLDIIFAESAALQNSRLAENKTATVVDPDTE